MKVLFIGDIMGEPGRRAIARTLHKLVAQAVNNNESRIIAATSVKVFFEKLIEGEVDLIIYDPDLDPIDTMGAFSIAKTYHPNIPSILIYENEDYEVTKSILDKGVIFRMLKPINKDDLQQIYDGFRRSKTRDKFDWIVKSTIA